MKPLLFIKQREKGGLKNPLGWPRVTLIGKRLKTVIVCPGDDPSVTEIRSYHYVWDAVYESREVTELGEIPDMEDEPGGDMSVLLDTSLYRLNYGVIEDDSNDDETCEDEDDRP